MPQNVTTSLSIVTCEWNTNLEGKKKKKISQLAVKCKIKWVFKLKANGCFHAQLVAKGFMQIPGIDHDETFSPIANFESLQIFLALAALEDWHIHQMDVKSAFLNGMLDEEIYMEQPQGFIVAGMENKVCKLKNLYMGSNKPPAHGTCNSMDSFWNLALIGCLLMLGYM